MDKNRKFQLQRKEDLREIRLLQRQEQKDCQVFAEQIAGSMEGLERKYEIRKQVSLLSSLLYHGCTKSTMSTGRCSFL